MRSTDAMLDRSEWTGSERGAETADCGLPASRSFDRSPSLSRATAKTRQEADAQMLRSMYTSVTGLRSHSLGLDVHANNIANVNTPGYKSTRASFAEVLGQQLRSAAGSAGLQVGLGTFVSSTDRNFGQGALLESGRATDFAIQGDGFFILGRDDLGLDRVYTRDGTFSLASDGTLKDAQGHSVLGWNAGPNGIVDTTQPLAPLKILVGQTAVARGTTALTMKGNLDGSAATGTVVNTTVVIYDSKGGQHSIPITLTKSATPNQWTVGIGALSDPSISAVTVVGNTIAFTNAGAINTALTTFEGFDVTYVASAGVANQTGSGGNPGIAADISALQQLSAPSEVAQTSQDGFAPGTLSSFGLTEDGIISGVYTNGNNAPLGILALASFPAADGLRSAGGNDFIATTGSGDPLIGQPGDQGHGTVRAGAFENSNVDLAAEFIAMISMQRGFQANARVITTSDDVLAELVSLKR